MLRNTVVSSYCVLIIIRQLKSLKFYIKEIIFKHMQHAAGFIRLPYLLEKGERKYQRNLYLIIRLKLENYWQKKWVYFLTWEKLY